MNDLRPVGTYAGFEMFVRGGSSYSCSGLKLHGFRDDLALRRGMRRELKKRGLPVPPIDSVVWAANPPRGSARGQVAVDVRGSVMPAWRWDVVESPGGKLVKRFKTDAALNAWLKRHDARGPNPLLAVAGNPGRKRNAAKLVLAGFVLRDSVTPGAWLARCEYVMGDSAIAQYVGHGWTARAALADLRAKLPAGVRLGVVTTGKVNPPLHQLGGSRGRVFGSQVEELKYRHVKRGARVHTFAKRGTKLEALPDGSVRLFNPKSRLWEDRVGT